MLTGDQLFAARTRAGMTQQQLADTVGATQRSVGNWERAERVPRAAEQKVRAALAAYLDEGASSDAGLDEVSDALLLAEIARRFDRGRKDVGTDVRSAPINQAGVSPANGANDGHNVTHLPTAEALDPTIPEDVAARTEEAKGRAQAERDRQDEEGEQ